MKSIPAIADGLRTVGRYRLFAGALVLLGSLTLGSSAAAVTFTQTLPMPGFTTGTTLLTETHPTLGTFDYSSTPYTNFGNLSSISITLALYDLQTMPTGAGADKRDHNKLTLTLGGIDTGIFLNGYGRNVGSTVTTTGIPTNSAAILAALTANGGFLTFGIRDATINQSNAFDYFGGTASLSLEITPVPFGPSSTLGFGIVAAVALLRGWPRLKRRFLVCRS